MSYGLAVSAIFLFGLVALQALLHIRSAPQRSRLADDTASFVASAVRGIVVRFAPAEDAQAAGEFAGDGASTATRWAIFLASRGMLAMLISSVSAAIVGLLTVFVAYQQVQLLESQTTIMADQKNVMITDNNNRLLEFHLASLLQDVRKNNENAKNLDAAAREPHVPWHVLTDRVIVISRALGDVPLPVPTADGRRVAPNKERGVLLATLVAEHFRFSASGETLWLQNADLAALSSPASNQVTSLGKIDLQRADATRSALHRFDFSHADLRYSQLPQAVAFKGSSLRTFVRMRELALHRMPLVMSVDLENAIVPNEHWLRELESVMPANSFSPLAWKVERFGSLYRVVRNSNAMLARTDEILVHAVDEELDCAMVGACAHGGTFCEQIDALVAQTTNARELGSLFVTADYLVNTWSIDRNLGPDARDENLRRQEKVKDLGRCLISAVFKPNKPVDLSGMSLRIADLSAADLTATTFENTTGIVHMQGAVLPVAENFRGSTVTFGRSLGGVVVPGADWEHRLCLAYVQAHPSRHEFGEQSGFDFDQYNVSAKDGRFLLEPTAGGCWKDRPWLIGTDQLRIAFCQACAPIAS